MSPELQRNCNFSCDKPEALALSRLEHFLESCKVKQTNDIVSTIQSINTICKKE